MAEREAHDGDVVLPLHEDAVSPVDQLHLVRGRRAAVARVHRDPRHAAATCGRDLVGFGDQGLALAHAVEEDDRRLCGDSLLVAAVAHIGEHRVGEREDHAAVHGPVAVEHVCANEHRQPRTTGVRFLDPDSPSRAGALL